MTELLQFLLFVGLLMLAMVSVGCLAVTYKIFQLLKKSDTEKQDLSEMVDEVRRMVEQITDRINDNK